MEDTATTGVPFYERFQRLVSNITRDIPRNIGYWVQCNSSDKRQAYEEGELSRQISPNFRSASIMRSVTKEGEKRKKNRWGMASKVDAPKIRSNIQQQAVLHQWRHDFSGCFSFLQFSFTGLARFSLITDCLP